MVKVKNIITFALALLLLCLFVFNPFDVMVVRADEGEATVINFDSTDILDDLSDATIDGKPFELADYPFVAGKPMQLFSLVEYCYSANASLHTYYNLYLYIYNPSGIDVDIVSPLNKVQLATSYIDGSPNNYSKLDLQFCSKMDDNLFYKFKLTDPAEVLSRVHQSPYSRQYDVSGIELLTKYATNASDYAVGLSYTYTGFAVGLGDKDYSTLECFANKLETLTLDVNATYYRPDQANPDRTQNQDQLNSVYFAVPNNYLNNYGDMYAMHVEWHEYKTKPIFLTGDWVVYNKLKDFVGQKISGYNKDAIYGLAVNYGVGGGHKACSASYNTNFGFLGANEKIDTLYWWLPAPGVNGMQNYGNVYDYNIPSDDLLDYIATYSNTRTKDILGKYSSDLFSTVVDEGRKAGYNETTIKADDDFGLASQVLDQNWWQKILGIKNYRTTFFDDIKGIHQVTADDFASSNKTTICNRLFVAESDYDNFKAFYTASTSQDKTVFLLRFAVTDYVSKPVTHIYDKEVWLLPDTVEIVNNNAYMAQQTVFLDFDVIDVTFAKNDVLTVIPVVASPIDIVAEVTPPPEPAPSWWEEIKTFFENLVSDITSIVDFFNEWGLTIIIGVLALIILPIILAIFPPLIKGILALLKIVFYIVFSPFFLILVIVKNERSG